MKKFNSKQKNILYFLYRVTSPVIDPLRFIRGLTGYYWFFKDYLKFNRKSKEKLRIFNIFPQLHDKLKFTPFDAHYFFQQLWVFENVLKTKPEYHVDVASTYELSGYLSKIIPTKFIDYRPVETNLENLEIIKGDITDLPLENNSVESLSCLHVVEHIGLGRYGDKIDPEGFKKASKELSRILSFNGKFYFSTPIGKENIYFNAHRVSNPLKILDYFGKLNLLEFSLVDDRGRFLRNKNPEDYQNLDYGCGMYLFTKKEK